MKKELILKYIKKHYKLGEYPDFELIGYMFGISVLDVLRLLYIVHTELTIDNPNHKNVLVTFICNDLYSSKIDYSGTYWNGSDKLYSEHIVWIDSCNIRKEHKVIKRWEDIV